MPRIRHGTILSLEELMAGGVDMTNDAASNNDDQGTVLTGQSTPHSSNTPFCFLFPNLPKNDRNLLTESTATVEALKQLGASMLDPAPGNISAAHPPSASTYFGQFVDHDVTFEAASANLVHITDPNSAPIPIGEIRARIVNSRTPKLDLDPVYGQGSVRDGNWMLIGRVSHALAGRPDGKQDYNDLLWSLRSSNKARQRWART